MNGDLKQFFKYIGPSMAGMVIVGTYSIVDTIFIGRAMGKLGLAAAAVGAVLCQIGAVRE